MLNAATDEEQRPEAMRVARLGGAVWWLAMALRLGQDRERPHGPPPGSKKC